MDTDIEHEGVFEAEEDDLPTEIELPDIRTESERTADEHLEKIDQFFSQLQPGATLLIERFQPSWCSGILEEITVSNEALTLDYFIDTWGGSVLGVKLRGAKGRFSGGAYKIPLHSYPPKVYGEVITKSQVMDRLRGTEKEIIPAAPMQNNQPMRSTSSAMDKLLSALPAVIPVFLKYMESSAERRQREMLMMMKMMNPASSGGVGSIADITKMGTALAELQKTFGGAGAGAASGEITDFIPQALGILETLLVKRQPEQPQAARLSAAPAPPNVRSLKKPSSVASSIADMRPQQAAHTIIEALGSMSPDNRSAAIQEFMGEYQRTMNGSAEDDDDGYEGTND
ncbi:MAG: hypothetical protein A2Y72_07710 [Chloroflexi bacterium RBG_13_53_26]|nr:MAG: hypothetical protein A2Y72_07710 [Chloroflexi bacterium RBG_13_53_26]